MLRTLARLHADSRGATAVEYGLIVGLIALAALAGITAFADGAVAMWEFIRTEALGNL